MDYYPRPLIEFSSAHRRLVLALSLSFVVLVSFQFHGYSLSAWHKYIDGSKPSEILYGRIREVRGDDFQLDLPSALAQLKHAPPFPLVNSNLAMGQYMLAPIRVPVAHWLMLFRPSCWGFFLGPDTGISWLWWTGVLGLFYSSFLLFSIISKNNFWISFFASLAFVYSPFFQFWSFHKVEIAIHAEGMILTLAFLLTLKQRPLIIGSGILLGWSTASLILDHMYPPFQVTMGYFVLFLSLALVAEFRMYRSWKKEALSRLIAVVLALTIVALAGISFYSSAKVALSLITQTEYPGSRFAIGGGIPLWVFLDNHFFLNAIIKKWLPLGNVCEASSFLYFFPLVYLFLFLSWFKTKKLQSRLPLILFPFFLFLLIYQFLGFPHWLSKITLFSKVTDNRLGMAFGFANNCLLVYFLSHFKKLLRRPAQTAIGVWLIFLLYIGLKTQLYVPEFKLWYLLLGLTGSGFFSYLLLLSPHRLRFWQALAGISIVYTFGFNPITRGGTDFIYHNPLAQKVEELDRESQHRSVWVTLVPEGGYGYASFLRMLGIHALDGHHGHPHFSLWKELDPQRERFKIFNQSAYVSFYTGHEMKARIESSGHGHIEVSIHPDSTVLKNLSVSHLLVFDDRAKVLDGNQSYERIYAYGNAQIYQRRGIPSLP